VVLHAKNLEPLAPPEAPKEEVENALASTEDERDNELSAAEMDAISQLLTADPVSREREQLARLKYAISEKDAGENDKPEETSGYSTEIGMSKAGDNVESPSESSVVTSDEQAAAAIAKMEKTAAQQADDSTKFSTDFELTTRTDSSSGADVASAGQQEVEDPVIAKLKKRLASMVDKIELQLSDVEREIGDKLHMLDKDADGVLSQEEMAECLRGVLKREITFEEAMEIAATMVSRGLSNPRQRYILALISSLCSQDENEDGLFTVQELYNWIETNKLVRFQSEGRDADMDRIMESKEEASSGDSIEPTEAKKQSTIEKAQH
jgi:hypothetical protein